MKSKSKNQHVVPSKGGWKVKGAGKSNASSSHKTQKAAIKAGRQKAKKNNSELVIHGKSGKIRDKDSYGNDPNPPKDTKH